MGRFAGVPALVLCALFLLPCVASAQDQASGQVTPRRVLVSMERSLLGGYSEAEVGILLRSFMIALSEAQGAPSGVAFGQQKFPTSQADRDKAAQAAGADCWLHVTIAGSRARPLLRVESYDLIYERPALGYAATRPEEFPVMDINRERWDDIVPLVVKAYPSLDPMTYSRGPAPPGTLVIRALPGTVITGLSVQPVTVGSDGMASVDVLSALPYSIRATLGGYVPAALTFYFDGQNEVSVPQYRSPWLLLDLAFLDLFYPGVAATLAASPFPGFARVGFTSFRAGLVINQEPFFSSIPLSQVTLLLGIYVEPEDKASRMYLGAGALLRVSLPPGGSLTVDGLLPWGIQAVVGWESVLAGQLRSFIEYAPSLYATPLPALFQAYFEDTTLPYLPLGSLGALNLFELRMGFRWAL